MTNLSPCIDAEVASTTFNRRRARRLAVMSAVCAASLYIASPFVTLWNISSAVQSHDMSMLGSHINWRSLGNSVKEQAIEGIVSVQPASDELPDFGTSFAETVVSNAIDLNLTQENLSSVVDQTLPVEMTGETNAKHSKLQVLKNASAFFTGLRSFEAAMVVPGHERETPLKISMKIQGWHWKITRVLFPKPRKSKQPFMEASAAANHA